MSKNRKTRNQKVLADQRHNLYHLEMPAKPSHSVEKNFTYQPHHVTPQTNQNSTYAYVISDVKKTFFITLSILFMQVILFFLMRKI